jgi:hypothetical protein
MIDTSCPHCGAEKSCRSVCEIIEPTSPLYQAMPFRCGSKNRDQSDLCREREAHNNTKRERDEARLKAASWIHEWRAFLEFCRNLDQDANDRVSERDELMQQNAKLRDIAERAVKNIREARNLSVIGDWREIDIIQERLRSELDQLKKEMK